MTVDEMNLDKMSVSNMMRIYAEKMTRYNDS